MAGATTILASAAIAGGAAKSFIGGSQAKNAEEDIANYQRQDLYQSNPFDNIQISTIGSELIKEEQNRIDAMLVDAIQSGGIRAMGGLGTVAANSNIAMRRAAADLDRQIINKEYAIASDEVQKRQMQEIREREDLAGLGQQLNVGRQQMWSGFGDMAMGGMMMASSPNLQNVNPQSISGSQLETNRLNNVFGSNGIIGDGVQNFVPGIEIDDIYTNDWKNSYSASLYGGYGTVNT